LTCIAWAIKVNYDSIHVERIPVSIEITGHKQWLAWQDGILPPVERVAGGLWSIPVPIPDNPLRYVLAYALEADDGLVLVDAGWQSESGWLALTRGLGAVGAEITDVRGVLVTHHHADHSGLAGRVREASGAWIAMHELDALVLKGKGSGRLAQRTRRHLGEQGVPAGRADLLTDSLGLDTFTWPALPDVLLQDGELLPTRGRTLRAVWTPGHTPGHTCFYEPEERLLFSGDHVLPRITPQIAVLGPDDGDPLAQFLLSLERLEQLEVDEVLPAHEYRFRGLAERTAAMARHHADRLAELLDAVHAAPGATTWDLSGRLTWSRPWESFTPVNQRFAVGETLAHLVALAARGQIRCVPEPVACWYPQGDPVSWRPALRADGNARCAE
jgi:glyoxylase-like metal-dependent hydrolase (beta-lactamase superfamily II)